MSDPAQRMRELRDMQEKIWRERQQAQLRNEAAQYLEGRIARDPMAGPNHHTLAPILQELGDHDEALRRLQFAAKANPENLSVRNDLALAIFQLRELCMQRVPCGSRHHERRCILLADGRGGGQQHERRVRRSCQGRGATLSKSGNRNSC